MSEMCQHFTGDKAEGGPHYPQESSEDRILKTPLRISKRGGMRCASTSPEFIGVYRSFYAPGVDYEEEFIGVYDTVMSLADYHHSEIRIHSKTSGLSAPADKKTLKTQEDIGERGNLSL